MGPDGITRGSYSYLDDKGVQRTVQYIAGAGIGYRVVQTVTGSGTHNLLRPTAPQFGIYSQQSNDLPPESTYYDATSSRGFGKESGGGSGGDSFGEDHGDVNDRVNFNSGNTNNNRNNNNNNNNNRGSSRGGKTTPSYDENDIIVPSTRRPFTTRVPSDSSSSTRGPSSQRGFRRPLRPLFDGPDPNSIIPETIQTRPATPTPPQPPHNSYYNRRTLSQYPVNDLRPTAPPPPFKSYPDYFGVNSVDFDKANIRAHVQNIDLLPISPRYPSPGDALKWDIIRGNK